MGCDIHAVTEVKLGGKWFAYRVCEIERNYSLFGIMAGVRQLDTPIIEPTGLPKDISAVTKLCRDRNGADGHTESCFYQPELRKLEEWADRNKLTGLEGQAGWAMNHWFGWLQGESITADELPANVQDVRVVFWFDN